MGNDPTATTLDLRNKIKFLEEKALKRKNTLKKITAINMAAKNQKITNYPNQSEQTTGNVA